MRELLTLFLPVTIIQYTHAVVCSKPWTFSHGNSCYYLGLNPFLTWGEARIQCIHDGGHLVIFETKEEEAFVGTYVQQHIRDIQYFIDATNIGQEGYWYWEHNGRNLTYTNWYVNEPRGRFFENCAWKFGTECNYKWIDINCAEASPYLCEKD